MTGWGRDIRDLLREHITQPLGLSDELMIGLPTPPPPPPPPPPKPSKGAAGDAAAAAAEVDGFVSRCATLCNGFGADGNAPTPEEMKELMNRIRTIRERREREEKAKAAAGADAGLGLPPPPAVGGGGEAAGSSSSSDGDRMDQMFHGSLSLIDPCLFNLNRVRRAVIPAANGHFTARALAKFYSVLAEGGVFATTTSAGSGGDQQQRVMKTLLPKSVVDRMSRCVSEEESPLTGSAIKWALGLRIYGFEDDSAAGGVRSSGFGHAGLGGSIAFCDPHSRVSIAVSVNKLSFHRSGVAQLLSLICDELGVGAPADDVLMS